MSEVIRVLLANDYKIVRKGIRCLIASQPGMEVIDEVSDETEVAKAIRSSQPDIVIVLTNHGFFDRSIKTIATIMRENSSTRVLVVSTTMTDEEVYTILRTGVLGYILKDQPPEDLFGAIRSVFRKKPALNSSVVQKLIQNLNPKSRQSFPQEQLSDRELEILRSLATGLPNKSIADRLSISERTVRTHVSNILGKLNLENRTQAALYAIRKGMADLQ
jgi:NarL family two-component system response regulator LiaR